MTEESKNAIITKINKTNHFLVKNGLEFVFDNCFRLQLVKHTLSV